MAPNNNNKKETPDVLGSVSQYSSRYNAGAARRNDGKRGQASSTSGTVRKKSKLYVNCPFPQALRMDQCHRTSNNKPYPLSFLIHALPTPSIMVHEDEDSGPTSTGNGSGDAKHLPSGSASTNRLPSGRQTVYEHLPSGDASLIRLPSGRQPVYEHSSSDDVSLNRLPSGRQNNHGHLPSSSVSMATPLPSNVRGESDVVMKGPEPFEQPSHGQTVDSKDEDGNVGALTRESEFDEFPDSDLDGLPEAEIEQLLGPALSRAPVADEDDGQKTRENVVEEFLDSDLDSLSETEIQRLLDQAVPKSAKAVDGNDSEAPAMDVGESHMGVEPIDVDAQILEEDRIDAYISNVEDDGMECFIDEEFIPDDVRENESLTVTEGTGVAVRAEQVFYDRAWVACEGLCQTARAEREWDSEKSSLSIGSWNWFRKTEAGELADIVYKRMVPGARQALSKPRPDVLDLLELPEPKRDDLADSCNGAGVYVFVCHTERKVDHRSGDLEAIDNDSVGCYTGQSIARPQNNGREGMSLRFDQHRRELRRTIPELEEKANKASTNVPRFYRTVVENKLEAHPRVVATLPRDGDMAAHAMLIETVIMIMTGSVSKESSNGLPTKDMVADIQEQLAFEGRLRYQPQTLNRALPVRQGFRVNACKRSEVYDFERTILESEFGSDQLIDKADRDSGVRIPGMARKNIPRDMRYCHSPSCAAARKNDGSRVMLTEKGQCEWSNDPAHALWVLCKPCIEHERKRMVRDIMAKRGIDVDHRRLKIHENDKVCSQENCKDPHQEGMKARMEAGEQAKHGHIWFRHPMEMGGRVVCKSCHMAVLLALRTEANRRALERINNSVD
ncbi:hypothetical protein H9Q70_004826 [Fusarium xylarioides]|nr:hypothetical protein H9Q70_004826 [Fusarium xylarioides]KAG5779961.1 hypothetical protein H9Q73_006395 [Fusarium xylarioides]